jgi:hypothetical protein
LDENYIYTASSYDDAVQIIDYSYINNLSAINYAQDHLNMN